MIPEIRKSNIRRLLLRYVRDHQLKEGDRLPGQNELRRLFDCGANTLTAAIQELCAEGVLVSRQKVGVFVVDAQATEQQSRRIGILTGRLDGSPFFAFLNMYLQASLNRYDCRSICFYQRDEAVSNLYNSVDDIVNLRASVENGELDGLISLIYCDKAMEQFLQDHGLGIVYASNYNPLSNHVCLDYEHIFDRSVEVMTSAGLKRIELLMTAALDWAQTLYLKACQKHGIAPSKTKIHCQGFGEAGIPSYENWVEQIFQEWISRPPKQRPDGLLIPDDMLMLRLHFFLEKHPEWHPKILTLCNRNMRIPFIDDSLGHWEFDIADYAECIVQHFITMLRGGMTKTPFHRFLPTFVPPNHL